MVNLDGCPNAHTNVVKISKSVVRRDYSVFGQRTVDRNSCRIIVQSFGFRVAASSGPIPKAPGSAGGYLPASFTNDVVDAVAPTMG